MVQMMSSSGTKASPESGFRQMVPVKREVDDPTEDPRGTLTKRSKQSPQFQQQGNSGTIDFPIPPSQYNPLDEPSPLGLRLRKSPSLLDLIQMTLSKRNSPKGGSNIKKENKSSNASGACDKLKASNFPASLLRIGTWEYKSRYEGDLVGKCYFAKHKLVWEVLDGGLKNKIEIQWSDILALKANYPDDAPGTLDLVLSREPLFFRETNPQPRKHTLWQATSDFTGGQASIQRRHFLQCPPGLLGKHFEKLIQCDPRLNFLSQQGEIVIDYPFFEPKHSVFEDSTSETNNGVDLNSEERQAYFELGRAASPSGSQSSPRRSDQNLIGRTPEQFLRQSTSPSSVIETPTINDIRNSRAQELKGLLLEKDHLKVPGLSSSMSMSDLVSQIEHRITEQRTSNNFTLSPEERQSLEILDDIRHCLFTESQHALATDEKCLMSRVNSLCCLLQKDPSTAQSLQGKSDGTLELFENKRIGFTNAVVAMSAGEYKVAHGLNAPEGEPSNVFEFRQAEAMSRKDSVGDLLLNLPRVASLPQFLYNISEDSNNEAR